jgi:hypothetical protein
MMIGVIMELMEILFLIFGWKFAVKGLVIASLVISSFWLIVTVIALAMGGKWTFQNMSVALMRVVVVSLSIICLCIR